MSIIDILAEEKIQEGLKSGAFDNLEGQGRPLKYEDLSAVPEDLRVGYKMLKNAGYLPEELQLRKEIVTLNELIRCCGDEPERRRLSGELRIKRLKFNQLMEKRSVRTSQTFRNYRNRMFSRLHM
ncbi:MULTISPECIES: DnaJ family domain-containing protein [unclassified Sporolactobacillus]|uniref:DnaJ family domain-containing protein n=1 Tax=unclassified Sporolactobacillus TaxID=2628533 RepID=UPI00236793B2|nr:DnaJ family domain-containing protein [Sporolactobacillus sp. CQH2019]MDD9150363.1 DUF1992 domain-containing protein [Sporolactobacillus sp. CQH2019]